MRDVGYLHARAGAAQALLRLGEREAARRAGARPSWPTCGCSAPRVRSGSPCASRGLPRAARTGSSCCTNRWRASTDSPALLELAHSLTELGAALRRAGQRAAAREPLAEALELAVRCGARRLAGRAREELKATGARPRREWRTGVEALTPSELRIVRLAAERPHQPRDRPRALRDPQDGRGPPLARLHQARDRTSRPASRGCSKEKRPGCQPSSERPTDRATLRLARSPTEGSYP